MRYECVLMYFSVVIRSNSWLLDKSWAELFANIYGSYMAKFVIKVAPWKLSLSNKGTIHLATADTYDRYHTCQIRPTLTLTTLDSVPIRTLRISFFR